MAKPVSPLEHDTKVNLLASALAVGDSSGNEEVIVRVRVRVRGRTRLLVTVRAPLATGHRTVDGEAHFSPSNSRLCYLPISNWLVGQKDSHQTVPFCSIPKQA